MNEFEEKVKEFQGYLEFVAGKECSFEEKMYAYAAINNMIDAVLLVKHWCESERKDGEKIKKDTQEYPEFKFGEAIDLSKIYNLGGDI